jgi:glycosyltransferase involved in cell wall biosynthesis
MKTEYDIVHINLVNVYAYACAQSFKNNKTKIIFHSHNPRNYNPSLIKCINDIVHRKTETLSNVLVACSDNAGKNTFKNHYKIIPNKVEIDKFLYSEENRKIIRRNLGLDNKCFVIGVVARITEQKNPYFILEIFEEIKKIKNDSILLWIGTGIEEENIKKLCKEDNLQKNVIFIKETDEIEKYYSAMDVFLLPSKYEGLGIVFIESQASGLISFASENVPKDIEISDLVTFLDANSSSKYWAENILKKAEFKINRKKYNDLIKKTIFFKKDEENELLELYNSIKEKEKI